MLVVQLKPDDEIRPNIAGKKIFILECLGCQDVYSASDEINKLTDNLKEEVLDRVRLDYICNRDFVSAYVKRYSEQIQEADLVLVFSCGVGTQVVSSVIEHKVVYTCCDTLFLNGFQGLNVQQYDCYQCGECYMNNTAGVCPLTNCFKGLMNGPCGGAQKGKCEVNSEADCAWVVIYNRLEKLKMLDRLGKVLAPRNYSKLLTQSLSREKIER